MFGLQLGHLLFGCAENTSKVLQAKDLLIQEAMSAVNVTRTFYQRQRQDDAFYDSVLKGAKELEMVNLYYLGTVKPHRGMTMEHHMFSSAILVHSIARSTLKHVTF